MNRQLTKYLKNDIVITVTKYIRYAWFKFYAKNESDLKAYFKKTDLLNDTWIVRLVPFTKLFTARRGKSTPIGNQFSPVISRQILPSAISLFQRIPLHKIEIPYNYIPPNVNNMWTLYDPQEGGSFHSKQCPCVRWDRGVNTLKSIIFNWLFYMWHKKYLSW